MTTTTAPMTVEPKPGRPIPLLALWVWLACVGVALAANSTGLRGQDLIWTDNQLLGDNQFLNRLPGLQAIWFKITSPETYPLPIYSPLTQTTFFIERMIWGNYWAGYRFTSILLHGTAGLMLWHLLRRLSIRGALAVALLFVAHPMTVESVTWLTERRNPLSALLGLSSVFLMLRAANIIPRSESPRQLLPDDPARLYLLGALLFVLGLFANAAIAPLPLAMLLVVWWRGHTQSQTLRLMAVLLTVAGMAMLSLTSTVEKARAAVLPNYDWNRADTRSGELPLRTQIAGRAVWFYAGKLALPYPLAFNYPRWQTPADVAAYNATLTDPAKPRRTPNVAPGEIVEYLFPAGVAAVVIGTWALRRRIGRGPAAAVIGFVLLLLPSLGFIDLGWMRYSFVANRAAYLASIPFLMGAVWAGLRLVALSGDRVVPVLTTGLIVGVYVIVGLLDSLNHRNAPYFWRRNANAILTSSGGSDGRIWLPRVEMARTLLEHNDIENAEGLKGLEQGVQLAPHEPWPFVVAGQSLAARGLPVEAMTMYEAVDRRFGQYAPAYFGIAELFRQQADLKPTDPVLRGRAIEFYFKAAQADPLNAEARVRFGQNLYEWIRRSDPEKEDVPAALDRIATAFDEAVQLRPYDPDLLYEIAKTLVPMRRLSEAAALLRTARLIDPERTDIVLLVADASLAAGYIDEADSSLQAAINLDPTLAEPYVKLGLLRKAQERWSESIEMFEAALRNDPSNAEAIKGLEEAKAAAATQPVGRSRPSGPLGPADVTTQP